MTLAALVAARPLARGASGSAVELAQSLLRRAGAEVVIDGDYGPITGDAVRRFQAARGLFPDGVIGPLTAAALDGLAELPPPIAPATSVLKAAPWLAEMRAISGEKELPGPANNPFILGMAKAIGERFPDMAAYCAEYRSDATAWCGLTAAYAMMRAGIRPIYTPRNDLHSFLWAKAWAGFGDVCEPRVGAVMVFEGHVSLYEGETKGGYLIRGGNQNNQVKVSQMGRGAFVGARWPHGWPLVPLQGVTS